MAVRRATMNAERWRNMMAQLDVVVVGKYLESDKSLSVQKMAWLQGLGVIT
jgi:hypothetical protein